MGVSNVDAVWQIACILIVRNVNRCTNAYAYMELGAEVFLVTACNYTCVESCLLLLMQALIAEYIGEGSCVSFYDIFTISVLSSLVLSLDK